MKQAILVGAGPSLFKHNHLEILAKSSFKGIILLPEVILKKALEAGITPEKFDIYATTLEDSWNTQGFFQHEIVKKYAPKLRFFISTKSPQTTIDYLKEIGVKDIKTLDKQDAVNSSNVGLFSYLVAKTLLKCDQVCLIGCDHGSNEYDHLTISEDSPIFKNAFVKEFNPDFGVWTILDPTHQKWKKEFLMTIEKYPINLVNCTEGGSLFGNGIKSMRFKKYLDKC